MKIKPVSIEVNNFLSYHHQKLNINNGLHFISGNNGTGKTSFFVEACVYCLYNKSMSGKKLSELINKDNNKNMFVNILINIDDSFHILVERGESPKRFGVYVETDEKVEFKKKNKVKIDNSEYISFDNIVLKKIENLAENKDMQEWLIENFLKMNHNDFITYVLKSKANDLSYLEMNKTERDKYLENLFNLSTFRDMIEKSKSKSKDQEYITSECKKDYDKFNNELEYEISKQEEIKAINEENKNKEIKSLIDKKEYIGNDSELLSIKSNINRLYNENNELESSLTNIEQKYTNLIFAKNESIDNLKENITNIENKYKVDLQDIEHDIIDLENELKNIDIQFDKLKEDITTNGKTLKSNRDEKEINLHGYEKTKELLKITFDNSAKVLNEKITNLNDDIDKVEIISVDKSVLDSIKNHIKEVQLSIAKSKQKEETTLSILKQFNIGNREELDNDIQHYLENNSVKNELFVFLQSFKSVLDKINTDISVIQHDFTLLNNELDTLYIQEKNAVESLETQLKNETYKKELESSKDILVKELNKLEKVYNAEKNDNEKLITALEKEILHIDNQINNLRTEYKNIENNKKLKFEALQNQLNNSISKKSSIIENYDTNLKNNNDRITELLNEIANFQSTKLSEIEVINSKKEKNISQITIEKEKLVSVQEKVNNLISEIDNQILELTNKEITIDNTKIDEIKKNIAFYKEKYNSEYNKYIRYESIVTMLTSKNNIKKYIMEKFRLYLNGKISYYSAKFKLPCLPLFNEEFDILLNGQNYEDLSIKSLSAGEMVKASLAILFASVDVKKEIYNHNDFQMLMFDEILANIDVNSINDILFVLSEYSNNLFCGVINHGHNDYSVDGINITIKKDKDGSHIEM